MQDCKSKLNQLNDDYLKLEDKYRLNIDDLNNLQSLKEDLEHKVSFNLLILTNSYEIKHIKT